MIVRVCVALILLAVWTSPAHAIRGWDPDVDCDSGQSYSPRRGEHPVRGVVFIGGARTEAPRWLRGHGEVHERRLPLNLRRLDYVASEGAILAIGEAMYSIAGTAATFERPRRVAMAIDARCPSVVIAVDAPLAALKARMTRGDRIEDYWLVAAYDRYDLFPINDGATFGGSVLELFAVYSDGSEHRLTMPIVVGTIPACEYADPWRKRDCRPGEHVSVAAVEEPPIDWRWLAALLVAIATLFAARAARPRTALHGLTMRGYLAKLRVRIRLARARIVRR